MPKRKKPNYAALAKLVRGYGLTIKRGKVTDRNFRRRVDRAYSKIKQYVANTKQEFVFRPLPKSRKGRKAVRDAVSKKAQTPTGFFFKVPKGVKRKNFKIDIDDSGTISVQGRGKKGGVRSELIRQMEPETIADNPEQAVKDILLEMEEEGERRKLPKPAQVYIMVNGFDGNTAYSWDAFLTYAPEFLKQLQDPNREAHHVYKGAGKNDRLAHSEKEMSPEEIADIFHVKLIYQKPSKHASKSKKKTTRNPRGSTGKKNSRVRSGRSGNRSIQKRKGRK